MTSPSSSHLEPSDAQPLTLYNRNGVIVRYSRIGDDVSEVVLEFLDADRSTAIVYCVAALYLAFRVKRPLEFVPSSNLLKRVVVFTRDLDEAAQTALVEAVIATQKHAPALFRLAEEHFYTDDDDPDSNTEDIVATAQSPLLDAYRKTDFRGHALGEAFAEYVASHSG